MFCEKVIKKHKNLSGVPALTPREPSGNEVNRISAVSSSSARGVVLLLEEVTVAATVFGDLRISVGELGGGASVAGAVVGVVGGEGRMAMLCSMEAMGADS